jgi:hypothetical protein
MTHSRYKTGWVKPPAGVVLHIPAERDFSPFVAYADFVGEYRPKRTDDRCTATVTVPKLVLVGFHHEY